MEKQKAKISLVKATLSSGKIVLLKQMKISHSEKAAMAVADRAGENGKLFSILMQKELVSLLLYKINDKELSLAEKDDMDSLFSPHEYGQVMEVIAKMNGGGDEESKKLMPVKIDLIAAEL